MLSSPSTERMAYQYVVLRCVPRVDREEFLNVAVVLYCETAQALTMRWHCDVPRLRAFAPGIDVDQVSSGLRFIEAVCAGDAQAGTAGTRPLGQRFGFIKAPRSTVIQPGPVHSGTTSDPEAEVDRLLSALVR